MKKFKLFYFVFVILGWATLWCDRCSRCVNLSGWIDHAGRMGKSTTEWTVSVPSAARSVRVPVAVVAVVVSLQPLRRNLIGGWVINVIAIRCSEPWVF